MRISKRERKIERMREITNKREVKLMGNKKSVEREI